MMRQLSVIAAELEKEMDERFLDPDGILRTMLKKDSLSPWEAVDFSSKDCLPVIPGYENMNFSDFMNYENTGMIQGTFLSAMCFKYQATGDPEAMFKAKRTFLGIRKVYEMSQKIARGFYCKPWGGQCTDETSSDQYIYTLMGLDDYYNFASDAEQKTIREMIVEMVRFWLDHSYSWKYYGRPLNWCQSRFIAFAALAVKYGGGHVFEEEWRRLDEFLKRDSDRTPFASTVAECVFRFEDGKYLSMNPESSLSTFLSMEAAMRLDNKILYLDICRRSFEYGKMGLAGDGTVYAVMEHDPADDSWREQMKIRQYKENRNQSPIYGLFAPYRKGGMQSVMFARFVLACEEFIPECGGRALAENILRTVGTEHLTWFEDPLHVMPEEIKWMTQCRSGDAVAHWLWCYWKLRPLYETDKLKSARLKLSLREVKVRQNPLENPDFEAEGSTIPSGPDGKKADLKHGGFWTNNTSICYADGTTENSYSGKRCALISGKKGILTATAPLDFSDGSRIFRFDAWGKRDTADGIVKIQVLWSNKKGRVYGKAVFKSKAVRSVNRYEHRSVLAEAPEDATHALLFLNYENQKGGKVYFDKAAFRKV